MLEHEVFDVSYLNYTCNSEGSPLLPFLPNAYGTHLVPHGKGFQIVERKSGEFIPQLRKSEVHLRRLKAKARATISLTVNLGHPNHCCENFYKERPFPEKKGGIRSRKSVEERDGNFFRLLTSIVRATLNYFSER